MTTSLSLENIAQFKIALGVRLVYLNQLLTLIRHRSPFLLFLSRGIVVLLPMGLCETKCDTDTLSCSESPGLLCAVVCYWAAVL